MTSNDSTADSIQHFSINLLRLFRTYHPDWAIKLTAKYEKKYLLLLVVLSSISSIGFGQQILNLDFEKTSVEGIQRPWGWALDGWGANVFSMDSIQVSQGKYSLYSDLGPKAQSPPSLQFNFEPYGLGGKTIKIKGKFNSQLTQGKSYISMGYSIILDENNQIDSTTIMYEITNNSEGWKSFEFTYTFPGDVTFAFIKIGCEGSGKVWYDDLRLLIDKREVQELPVASEIPTSEIDWIKNNSVPFGEFHDTKQMPKGFQFLKDHLGQPRILALGESTHGTSEFFTLKHQMFKFAVEEMGFRVFALEDNQLACEKVNQYILGQLDIETKEAMSHFFAVWYTDEVRDLIQWMKERNARHPNDPVYFAGFDMQDYKLPLQAVTHFLTDKKPGLLTKLKGFDAFAGNHFSASDSTKSKWLEITTEIYESMKNEIDHFENGILELQNAKLLQQFTENVVKGHWSLYRDEAMADNVSWLANIRYPGEKIFIWAHDIHVSMSNHPNEMCNMNNGIAMGHFFKRKNLEMLLRPMV